MRLNGQNATGNGFTTLASFVIIAAVLYFARTVFIPIALASLLTFLLAPLVVRLGRWGLGKIPSIFLVVVFAFTLLTVIGWLVLAQTVHLADQLPNYRQNFRSKMLALKRPNRHGGVLSKLAALSTDVRQNIASLVPDDEPQTATSQTKPPETPVPVEVKSPKPTPFQLIGNVLGPVLKPLGMAGAVVFLVVLMLFQREDLRERFLKLVSNGQLNVATQAVDDAAQRVSRYLLMQLVVNSCYGVPIGVGLYFIGVPNAFLWGLLATLLRFIPFIGPWIAASFPLILAFAIDPGWTKLLLTVLLYVVVEVLCNNLIEPWLYGASTGVSNIALLLAAVFWTWLWGTIGLLLSTPLTVCLLVLGKYVPGLAFLSVLLGSDPVLDPSARLYQRMLAMDEEELFSLAQKFLKERSLAELYDFVLIPALSMAEQDRHKGTLAELRQAFILQTTRELIDTLGEDDAIDRPADKTKSHPPPLGSPVVLCIPAKDDADELAALMLAQLLGKKGISAEAVSAKALARQRSARIRRDRIRVVCISGIPPFAVSPARLICRRLRQEFPRLQTVVGIWNPQAQPTEVVGRLGSGCHDALVTRLADAVTRIETMLDSRTTPAAPDAHLVPELALGSRSRLAEAEPEEVFESVTREAAQLLNLPISLVSLLATDQEFWKVHGGLPWDIEGAEVLKRILEAVGALRSSEILEVEDVAKDTRFSEDEFLQDRGIRFIARVPLRTKDGHVVGSLCITDTEPHLVSDDTRERLCDLGAKLINAVERRVEVVG